MVTVVDVGTYHVGCHVSDRSEELTRAPEATLTEVSAQPRVLAKELISALSLKQVERTRDAHLGWQAHKHVHMVGFNVQLKHIHAMFTGNIPQEDLAVFAQDRKLEGVHCILGFCLKACPLGTHEVERVLSYATVVANQSFHFLASAQTIETAHTNQMQNGECANYAAHSPIKERRNKEVTSKERYDVIAIPLPPKRGSILATM
jgi:hypothetical protein